MDRSSIGDVELSAPTFRDPRDEALHYRLEAMKYKFLYRLECSLHFQTRAIFFAMLIGVALFAVITRI